MKLNASDDGPGFLQFLNWRFGDGLSIPFWTTKYFGSSLLYNSFPNLYLTTLHKSVSVGDNGTWMKGRCKWKIDCDPLLVNYESVTELTALEQFLMEVRPVINNPDRVIWPFEAGFFWLSLATQNLCRVRRWLM